MFRNIKNYMGRPILTKQLLNTAPDKEKVTINTVPGYLACGAGFRQQFS
jgi:hypothetical protein